MSHDHFHILFIALFLILFLGVYLTGVFYKAYYDQKIKNLWGGLSAVTEEVNKGFKSLR